MKLKAFTISSILCVFCGMRFGILNHSGYALESSLTTITFLLWLVALCFIALGGLIFNYHDTKGTNFAIFNFVGVAIGYYVGYSVGNFNLGTLLLIISALIYVSLSQVRQLPIMRYSILALCAGLSVLFYGVFELVHYIKLKPDGIHRLLFSIITDYSLFLFTIILALGFLYDLKENSPQQKKGALGVNHQFGFTKSMRICGIILLVATLGYTYYLYTYMYLNTPGLLVGLFAVVAPLLTASIMSFKAHNNHEVKLIYGLSQIPLIGSALVLMVFYFLN